MKFYIREEVHIHGAPKDLKKKIKSLLTIPNPHFAKKIQMELSVWGIDSKLFFFREKNQKIIVPIGSLEEIISIALDDGYHINSLDLIDCRVIERSPEYFENIKFKGKLRDYQQETIDAQKDKTIGVIEAQTGSGKTVIFIYKTLSRNINTLILVNTKELAEQTKEAFLKFSNLKAEDIGFIGSGTFDIKPISIALLQTMRALDEDKLKKVKEYFGQIIADEVHIIAADTYYNVMKSLPSKYKWGYSATPSREDGLTPVIHWATGPLIHKVGSQTLKAHLIKPEYRQVKTDYYFPMISSQEYQTMITHMAEDKERNQLILDTFEKNDDKPSLFLCNRTSQVEILHKKIPRSIMLTSKMTKKQRKKSMEKIRSGEADHVVSTWGLFSTGIDIPKLTYLYICGPMRSKIKIRQAAGRLMRKSKGKFKSFIIDFVDHKIGLLIGQATQRKRIINKLQ